ncbi:MAG: phosphatase PAP2 family protein [Candidatus Humimicrobiaceae bacterium]
MKFFNFIKCRFNINKKNGLYLTLGTVVSSIFFFIFFNFTEDIFDESSLMIFDRNVIEIIESIRTPFLNKIMAFITYTGNSYTIAISFFMILVLLIILKKRRYLYALFISISSSAVFVTLIKNIIGRQRPPIENALIVLEDFSFPSGHSYMAVAFYGMIIYFIFDLLKKNKIKFIILAAGIIFILILGFSRLYLGVHWPSDIFAGLAAAIALITAIITILEIKERFQPVEEKPSTPQTKKRAIISGLFMFSAWVIYMIAYYILNPLI